LKARTNRSQEFTRAHVPTIELLAAVLAERAAAAEGRDVWDVCTTPVLFPELQPAATTATARNAAAMAGLIEFRFLSPRSADRHGERSLKRSFLAVARPLQGGCRAIEAQVSLPTAPASC
jgi:hypothetical protein